MKKMFLILFTLINLTAFAQVELVSGGSANAYTLAFPGVFSYSNGISFTFKANFANTGSATINVNSLGAKNIKKHQGADLAANDIKNGQVVTLVYDGTNFQITSGLGNAPGGGGGGTLTGDVTGDISSNTVEKIRGVNVVGIPPSMNQVLQFNGVSWAPATLGGGGGNPAWELGGNSGTDSSINFIGTLDEQPLVFKLNDMERMKLRLDGGLTLYNGNSNLMVGSGFNVSGIANTVVGINAEAGSGNLNTSLGAGSMNRFTTGDRNLAIGPGALGGDSDPGYPQPEGDDNIAIGYVALQFNSGGDFNIGIGNSVLNGNSGNSNIGIGHSVLWSTNGNQNIGIGNYAMYANGSGSNNIGIGEEALYGNTSGFSNIALGKWALKINDNGDNNIAIGELALNNNYSGRINTAIGGSSLQNSSTGGRNVAVGTSALFANTSGNDNVAVGVNALRTNTTGSNNTAIGDSANVAANNLSYATAIGANAVVAQSNSLVLGDTANIKVGIGTGEPSASLHIDGTFRLQGNGAGANKVLTSDANGNASWQTAGGGGGGGNPGWELLGNSGTDSATNFIGTTDAQPLIIKTNNTTRLKLRQDGALEQYMGNFSKVFGSFNSLGALTTGVENSAFGDSVMLSNTSGSYNSAFGFAALKSNTTGSNNTAIGDYALVVNTTGFQNTAVGTTAMWRNTSGTRNTGVGVSALLNNTTGFQNSAFGTNSLFSNTTGQENTALGYNALNNNSTGSQNTVVGAWAMTAANTSSFTTAIGYGALTQNTSGSNNTAVGGNSMFASTTGGNNTAVGRQSMQASTSGASNTALGYQSLGGNTTGSSNTAVGIQALNGNTTGTNNTAIGNLANVGLAALTNASAIGSRARVDASNSMVLGSINGVNGAVVSTKVGIGTTIPSATLHVVSTAGAGTGFRLVDGSEGANKVLTSDANGNASWQTAGGGGGGGSGWNLTGNSGTNPSTDFVGTSDLQPLLFRVNNQFAGMLNPSTTNTSFGYASYPGVSGNNNTAIGTLSMPVNIGDYNSALGVATLNSNTSGSYNTAIGSNALNLNTDGSENVAIGVAALNNNTSGTNNVAIGVQALNDAQTGTNNVAIGHHALQLTSLDAGHNVAVGAEALKNTQTNFLTAVGHRALAENTYGTGNAGFGAYALANNTGGSSNVAIGEEALSSHGFGDNNTALGYRALAGDVNGNSNIAIGKDALKNNAGGGFNTVVGTGSASMSNTGNHNAFFGYSALSIGDGSGITILGSQAIAGFNTTQNTTVIGASTFYDGDNAVRLGNSLVTTVEGPVAYTVASDARFKTNVSATDVKGLDFITKLRPVNYNFDTRKYEEFISKNLPDSIRSKRLAQDFTHSTAIRQTGFIAQEVEQAAKETGYDFSSGLHTPKTENGYYTVAYSQFVVPLVKAVQELNQKVEALEKENAALKSEKESKVIGYKATYSKTTPVTVDDLQNQINELKKLIEQLTKNR